MILESFLTMLHIGVTSNRFVLLHYKHDFHVFLACLIFGGFFWFFFALFQFYWLVRNSLHRLFFKKYICEVEEKYLCPFCAQAEVKVFDFQDISVGIFITIGQKVG